MFVVTRRTNRAQGVRPRGEVVEQRVRVGLGPYTDATGTTERGVVRVDPLRAVPVYLHMISLELGPQLVPVTRCHLPAPVGELDPASVPHVVEADVVLKRIRAREIIVVLILVAEYDAAGAVDAPRYRLALHRDAAVGEARRRCRGDRESVVGAVAVDLGEDVRRTRRVWSWLHNPAAQAAAAGPAEGETGRRLTRGQRIEMPNDGRRRLAIQRHGLSSTWVLWEAKDSAEGDRAQHRHGASTGSFHLLLIRTYDGTAGTLTKAPGSGTFQSTPAVWVIQNGKPALVSH